MTEILVTVSLRFPQMDRCVLGDHLAPTIAAAIGAGGELTSVSVQNYDPDEDDEADE